MRVAHLLAVAALAVASGRPPACAHAQTVRPAASPVSRPATPTPFDAPRNVALAAGSVVVPLTKIGDFFYADVRLNGKPFRFTLETGASFIAISANAAAALGLKPESVEPIPGSRTPVVQLDSLSVGGATFGGLAARVTTQFDGMGFDGIISVPLLRNLLWTLDLGASRLILERGALPPVDGREVLPIAGQDRGERIDVMMFIGGLPAAVVFDTRYAGWIIVSDSFIPRLQLDGAPRYIGSARGPSLGAFDMQGARLTGAATLGGYSAPKAPIVFRNRPGSIVGVSFLEQFSITVDQTSGRVRVRRPAGRDVVIPPLPWELNGAAGAASRQRTASGGALKPGDRTLGFRLAGMSDSRLKVVELAQGSAAAMMGIRESDELVEFDGTAASALNPSVFRAALSRGGPLKIVLLRDGKRLVFSIEPFVVPPPADAPAAVQSADTALARAITSYVDAESAANRFSGVVLVARAGAPVVELARGSANRKAAIANIVDTRFQLASGDKWFTKIAISQLVAAGKVKLSDTVGKYLPDYPSAVVRSRVTVEQLLLHRSGLGMYWNAAYVARREHLKTLADVVALFSSEEPAFTPGERQQYSNNGFVLLGRIVEVASGLSYYDYVQQRIFTPAGMTRTAYLTLNEWPADKAIGYVVEDSAAPTVENTRSIAFRGSSAGGGYSTARD
nr:serine hydrolase [Gemmatimonadaceae bacterium]